MANQGNRRARLLTASALLAVAALATPRAQTPAPQTFRASTRLVTIDALVHRRNGEPVRDLTAADFKLFEDGKLQTIAFFEVVAARGPATRSAPEPPVAATEPGTFTNRPNGAAPSAATVVLFDRLNSGELDQIRARAEIIRFLGQVRTDQRIALYVLESEAIRVLHDFTHDSESLVRTMAAFRARASAERAIADEAPPPFAATGIAQLDAEMAQWLAETNQAIDAALTKRRGEITLAAIESIAGHLSGIPGRKNLVWVSSAFPMVITDKLGPQTLSAEMTRTVRAVNNANLSIYPIDVRGLVAPNQGPQATASFQRIGRGGPPPPQPVSAMVEPAIDTMKELAERTGGRAFFNSNAIGQAIERAIDDARVTYLIGYYPTNSSWDGKFRKLRVTVNTPDVDVRHRSGYLALPAAPRNERTMTDLARSSLESTGIGLTVALDGRTLTIRVDPSAISLRPSGEFFEATLDILIAQTTKNGDLVKDLDKKLDLRLTRAQRDDLLREGFTMTRTVERRPDAQSLRVVVRDTPTGVAGSVLVR